MIYLDNAATAKPLPLVEQILNSHCENGWFNPSALYGNGATAQLETARVALCRLAKMPGAIFTSGATEANNQAIFCGYKKQGGRPLRFVTSSYEHPSVYECFRILESQGHSVHYVDPKNGIIAPEDVADIVTQETALVSIMHVNNETGAINDISEIAAAVKRKNPNTLFHSDGVQGFVKVNADMSNVDFYTASAHKIGGLKGTGVLFYKKAPGALIHGGGQENALRSGTENTAGVAVFAACANYLSEKKISEHFKNLNKIAREILSKVDGVKLISGENSAPHILAFSMLGAHGETLSNSLAAEGIIIGIGSACSSKKKKTSRLASALGLSKIEADGFIRLSFSTETSEGDVKIGVERLVSEYKNQVKLK